MKADYFTMYWYLQPNSEIVTISYIPPNSKNLKILLLKILSIYLLLKVRGL